MNARTLPAAVGSTSSDRTVSEPSARPGTLAYLRETLNDCVDILKHDNDQAEANAAIRAAVEQHKRLTVAEVHQLDREYRRIGEALLPYKRSAFNLPDLLGALVDAGYEADECRGDPAIYFSPTADEKALEVERRNFHIALGQAAPRYAEAILDAATWYPISAAYVWDAGAIERRAA